MMISGDVRTAAGAQGEFYEMLQVFRQYWDRIDVVCPKTEKSEYRHLFENVHIHPAGKWAHPDIRSKLSQPYYSYKKAEELIDERDYGLMTIHEVPPFHVSFAALKLARKQNVPVMSEIMHIEGYPIAPDLASRLRRIVSGWWIPYMWPRVDGIRTINAIEVPEYLRARGVPREKIKVLYAVDLDLELFSPGPAERDIDFLFVGRLVENKGLDQFIRALGLAKINHPDLKAVIIGNGPLDKEVRSLAAKHRLAGNLQIIPWVKDRVELTEHYRRAKALVVCSFAEGGPNVALEAMACKTPVIGPRIGILTETLNHGVNAIVIDHTAASLAGAMEAILNNPGLAEKLGKMGPLMAQRFESGKIIKAYAQGLREVAKNQFQRRRETFEKV